MPNGHELGFVECLILINNVDVLAVGVWGPEVKMSNAAVKYSQLLFIVLHDYSKLVFIQATLLPYQGNAFKLVPLYVFVG